MHAASPLLFEIEDYLLVEAAVGRKSEWSDGVVYPMPRRSPEHARLATNIGAALGAALGPACEVHGPGAMIFVEAAKLATYADAIVVCGPLVTKKASRDDRRLGEAITNPTILVEVVNEATERYVREQKFNAYRQLASFEEYVLVVERDRSVEVYRRDAEGGWSFVDTAIEGESVTVHGARLAVDDVYR